MTMASTKFGSAGDLELPTVSIFPLFTSSWPRNFHQARNPIANDYYFLKNNIVTALTNQQNRTQLQCRNRIAKLKQMRSVIKRKRITHIFHPSSLKRTAQEEEQQWFVTDVTCSFSNSSLPSSKNLFILYQLQIIRQIAEHETVAEEPIAVELQYSMHCTRWTAVPKRGSEVLKGSQLVLFAVERNLSSHPFCSRFVVGLRHINVHPV
jgi:hypothetical protein